MFKINKDRIVRTLIQSASGAGVAFLTSLTGGFDKGSLLTAVVTFVTTVGIAVLMNISKQCEDGEN